MQRQQILTIFLLAIAANSYAQGVDVQSSTVAEPAELIRVDAIRWAKLVKAAGLVLE